jgi:hypothetical protein
MANVYERQRTEYKGSFASDNAVLSTGTAGVALGIVQQLQITFAQQISRIYDVTNGGTQTKGAAIYYVGGRTQGQATIARVVGPDKSLCSFYKTFGNVCDPKNLDFTLGAQCGPDGSLAQQQGTNNQSALKYTLTRAVITNVGLTVAAQDMIVNESVTLVFADLECDDGGGSSSGSGGGAGSTTNPPLGPVVFPPPTSPVTPGIPGLPGGLPTP